MRQDPKSCTSGRFAFCPGSEMMAVKGCDSEEVWGAEGAGRPVCAYFGATPGAPEVPAMPEGPVPWPLGVPNAQPSLGLVWEAVGILDSED